MGEVEVGTFIAAAVFAVIAVAFGMTGMYMHGLLATASSFDAVDIRDRMELALKLCGGSGVIAFVLFIIGGIIASD